MKAKTKLTIGKIERLKSGEELWDAEVHGLHIRGLKTGKFFYLFYRNKYGDQRKPALGRYGSITLEAARQKARSYLFDLSNGNDPSLSKQEDRAKENPTVHDLKSRWENEHAHTLKTAPDQIRMWNRYILPVIGDMKIRDVSKNDIQRLLASIQSNGMHNRVRALLSKSLNLAEEWEWRDDFTNPIRKIKKRPEVKRRRYLRPDEVSMLGAVLRRWKKRESREANFDCFIYLLMYTGARRSEILNAKWSYIDWHRGVLDLPDSKTGAKEIILSAPALLLLKELESKKVNDWIITNHTNNNPIKNPHGLWVKLCTEAGVENIRMHDLRHSFASAALSSAGGTLPQVGELLGHADPKTTARYAHFMTSPKRVLADKTAETLESWLSGL